MHQGLEGTHGNDAKGPRIISAYEDLKEYGLVGTTRAYFS